VLNVRGALLEWARRRKAAAYRERARAERDRPQPAETPKPHVRPMVGKYMLLYKYLEGRYANTVVLTFAEIEDLLGFALPDQARFYPEWWSGAEGTAARRQPDRRAESARPQRRLRTRILSRTK
jgi:hypothetical protein